MSFFPDVIPGQRVKPSALLENNIRHIVNAYNGYSGNAQLSGIQKQNNTVSVYNSTQTAIPANTAVSFVSSADKILGVVPFNGSDVYGITTADILPNAVGSAVIGGAVFVSCTGTGNNAKPQIQNPSVFLLGNDGFPVLYSADGRACINMGNGGSNGEVPERITTGDYEFALVYNSETGAIRVNGGYVHGINGNKWVKKIEHLEKLSYQSNTQYVVWFQPYTGDVTEEAVFRDINNNAYYFKTFADNEWELTVSKSFVKINDFITLYLAVIGTFWTDENGNMDLSSWNQIHAGSMFMPYLIPPEGHSEEPPEGTTQDPDEPVPPKIPENQVFQVKSATLVSSSTDNPQYINRAEYRASTYVGYYIQIETPDRKYWQLVDEYGNPLNRFAITPSMSTGRCGFADTDTVFQQAQLDFIPEQLQMYPESQGYEHVDDDYNEFVFDFEIEWLVPPPNDLFMLMENMGDNNEQE